MTSFVVSVCFFVVMVAVAAWWQHRNRKSREATDRDLDQQLNESVAVAQRRYIQRYGRPSTDLVESTKGAFKRPIKAHHTGAHFKI